ncbi:MAG: disulfide bond formation protein DsbA [Promicromonosporaceae bacterium]|nr:disulfide bond formation protein DsbA [Promicromonosporaceae bacterium]
MSKNQTKAQRREAARAEAAALKARQEAAERRNKRITFGALGAVVAALLAVVLIVIFTGGDDEPGGMALPNPTPEQTAESDTPPLPPSDGTPTVARADFGIVLGPDGRAGGPERTDIPELGIYFDYMCSACYRFEMIHYELLLSLADEGAATVVLYPVVHMRGDSPRVAAASLWVADYAPDQWFDYHVALFYEIWGEGSRNTSNAALADLATEVGVPEQVTSGIRLGESLTTFEAWLEDATAAFRNNPSLPDAQGRLGTPAIAINGERWVGSWPEGSGVLAQAIIDAAG